MLVIAGIHCGNLSLGRKTLCHHGLIDMLLLTLIQVFYVVVFAALLPVSE